MTYGKMTIVVCENYEMLGEQSASAVASCLRDLLAVQADCRIVFSAAESQGSFVAALARQPDIDWSRVVCFNIDDFWRPGMPLEFSCGHQTRTELYEKVPIQAFHQVNVHADDPQGEADRFETLLREAPLDIMCLGIGTSGHLALNEPGQTSFADDRWVRVVDVDEQSKRQLMDDPNFKDLGYIPEQGITTTIPAILSAKHFFVMVPLANKKAIVTEVLKVTQPTEDLPASILSTVSGTLFLDRESCPDG